MADSRNDYAVQMYGITKRFPGVLANHLVDLEVMQGEVLALLGENGAGKSTLMNVLAGMYLPDEGEVLIHGRKVELRSPRDAIANGIGMVHQHFMLVPSLTVAENVILGLEGTSFFLDLDTVRKKLVNEAARYQLGVDPNAYIWQLSVGEQQRVEILKLLYRGAEVLILDEPTAVLTPQEAAELAGTLQRMASEGKTVLFITHKLDEVMEFSDRVTVLRGGKVVSNVDTKDTSREELARLMVGREVLFRLEKADCKPGEIALEVQGLRADNDKGLPALRDVGFCICRGEILGVAGVAGNGQRELAEVITGLRRLRGGSVVVNGIDITNASPREAINAGVSHIPGDRLGMGLAPNLPVSDNLVMKAYRQPPLAKGMLLNNSQLGSFARRLIELFSIATPGPETPARLLSGGNQQRVVLAREIEASRGVMIAVNPSRGLDVGATESVRKSLLAEREKGAAILLVSEELDELTQLSDRIIVFFEGEVMGVVRADEAVAEEIGLMMAGEKSNLRAQPLKMEETQ
ncbi:MAG: ABC transporter ATP-binding protein [Anaerolineales bacterium]|nr:ABC transporter ATP-binding protein [Anaerolineales bacterium]